MNSFGTASVKYPLYDARSAREERARFRRDEIPELSLANGLYVPAGRYPTRGWILLARTDYDKLDRYSTSLELECGDPRVADNVSTLKNLAIVQAQCVTRGIVADKNALYLVELTDGRGILCNQWFQFPITAAYNIRALPYPDKFYDDTMNSGSPWTWETMLQDMWLEMTAFLGTWPGLPSDYTPHGTPEGWWFSGVPAWIALCDVLDHLGLTVACDLTLDNPYTIVRSGIADTSFDSLTTKYATHLEDDMEWIDVGAGRVPATVEVLFRRRNEVYGTEETVRYDSLQWATTAYYTVSINAPSTFTGASGLHHIWSDLTVRYDMDGSPLAADVTLANARAQVVVDDYFATIYDQTLGRMSRRYAGALPFATGSRVDGVSWVMNYRDPWAGWQTRLSRGACPPFAGIW